MKANARYDFSAFDAKSYFPALDGLRAVSVTLVMCNHLTAPVPSWVHGFVGVDVFFVLSGFLITRLLLRERATKGSISLRSFYLRRSFRIVPAYLVTVAVYFAATRAIHDELKIAEFDAALPWLLTFMREYAPPAAGNVLGHAWTLGVEEKFYLLWPLLLIFLFPFRRRDLVVLALVGSAALFVAGTMARAYAALLVGVLLSIATDESTRSPATVRAPPLPWPLVLAALVGAYTLAGSERAFLPMFAVVVALLIGVLLLQRSRLRTWLEHPWLVFVGRRSYSMYLVHVLAANAVSKLGPRAVAGNWLLALAAGFILSLASASILYAFVEQPCIRFGRALAMRKPGPASAPAG